MPPNEDVQPLSEEGTGRTYSEVAGAYNAAVDNVSRAAGELEKACATPDDYTDEQIQKLREELAAADKQAQRLNEELNSREIRDRARSQYKKLDVRSGPIVTKVTEPDMYVQGGRSFLTDLYYANIKHEPPAVERVSKHHSLEIERRGMSMEQFAMGSAALGGIIPPAYLIELYAKASRNGRVYADQANDATLP